MSAVDWLNGRISTAEHIRRCNERLQRLAEEHTAEIRKYITEARAARKAKEAPREQEAA